MKKIFLCGILVFSFINIFSQTKYYKLHRKVIDGITIENVSGGQFITFTNNKCYESDHSGFSVGNGTLLLMQNEHGISQYIGEGYWGDCIFKFNSNKTILNIIVIENGDIYVYKQKNPPANVTTCSLIRKKSSNHNPEHTPIMTDVPIQEDNENQTTASGHYEEYFEKCIECNGQGFILTKTYMGGGEISDIKRRCAFCHGTGQIRKSKYVID